MARQRQQGLKNAPSSKKRVSGKVVRQPGRVTPTLIQRAQTNPQALTPTDVIQLQRTIGMQATSHLVGRESKPKTAVTTTRPPAIQRYVVWGEPGGKEMDVGTDSKAYAPAGKSLSVKTKEPTEGIFPSQAKGESGHYDQLSVKSLSDVGSLKIADTGDFAIENVKEPKAFFASSEKLEEANQKLLAVHSAYKLLPQGPTIQVGEKTLLQTQPRNRLTDTEGLMTTSLHRCNEMASRVMGLHYQQGATRKFAMNEMEEGKMGKMQAGVLKELFSDTEFSEAYASLTPEEKLTLAKLTGINEFAAPDIGEAFQIKSLGEQTAEGGEWNYHWAGVVAKSASDFVTLENYNRNDEKISYGSKGEDKDVHWFFQMYGKVNLAQTFYQRQLGPAFKSPITLANFKNLDKQLEQNLRMEHVRLNDREEVAKALTEILGIASKEVEKLVIAKAMEEDTEVMSATEYVLLSEDGFEKKLRTYLSKYVLVPEEKLEPTVTRLKGVEGLTEGSSSTDWGTAIKKFAPGIGLGSYKYSAELWTKWNG